MHLLNEWLHQDVVAMQMIPLPDVQEGEKKELEVMGSSAPLIQPPALVTFST